jgi:hypothetical protein
MALEEKQDKHIFPNYIFPFYKVAFPQMLIKA